VRLKVGDINELVKLLRVTFEEEDSAILLSPYNMKLFHDCHD
jgi:hypothetical protein